MPHLETLTQQLSGSQDFKAPADAGHWCGLPKVGGGGWGNPRQLRGEGKEGAARIKEKVAFLGRVPAVLTESSQAKGTGRV